MKFLIKLNFQMSVILYNTLVMVFSPLEGAKTKSNAMNSHITEFSIKLLLK